MARTLIITTSLVILAAFVACSNTPEQEPLTIDEYIDWCSTNTSNDTAAKVLNIDPYDFGDASTITWGEMLLVTEAHIEVLKSIVPPTVFEKFHNAQIEFHQGSAPFYKELPSEDFLDPSIIEVMLEDDDQSWRILRVSSSIEQLAPDLETRIRNNCVNRY